jgi:hypothetical protein
MSKLRQLQFVKMAEDAIIGELELRVKHEAGC